MTNDRKNRTIKSKKKNQNVWRKGNLQGIENIGSGRHQTCGDERKRNRWRTRKLLETKLRSRNLIKDINTWIVPLVRYSGVFLKWTRDELKQMDLKTRKLMTMHKALYPRDDTYRLSVSRKEGEIALMHRYKDTKITNKHGGRLITAITENNTDNANIYRTEITRKKWKEKQLYEYLKRKINEISHEETWTWLRKGNLTIETESLLIAAQNNAIRTMSKRE